MLSTRTNRKSEAALLLTPRAVMVTAPSGSDGYGESSYNATLAAGDTERPETSSSPSTNSSTPA